VGNRKGQGKGKGGATKSIPTPKLSNGQIPFPTIPASELLSFSFKYLDCIHPKFSFRNREVAYYSKIFERMKNICTMKIGEIKNTYGNSKALRCHSIEWSKTSEPDGFSCLNEQLRQQEPYQFCISQSAYGRVVGFIVDSVFFVVWFDHDHALYS